MPTVQFKTREVQEMLGGNAGVDVLRARIPMLGVDLVSIDDESLEMEIFPNRPDMLSVEGFVRALRGFMGLDSGFVDYPVNDSNIILNIDSSVRSVRPFAAAAAVYNVCITEDFLVSIMNVQEKLHLTHGRNRVKVAIGIHDLGKVESPFTYKAVKPDSISFVPLDMETPLNLQQILSRHPKGRDYAFTLEGAGLYPVIVDRNERVLSFPPIINGELTRVTRDTTDLFIEITGKSELAVDQALSIVVCALGDRGGKIASVEIKK
ncbi:MAG: phenylalanine--tRNA ligase subunit beta [Candidatus Altiarchaeota archaeon]|nr:phenylalanine--tRNA ligase subunit beta [Candidatus Altiarchaeota archaeon]